MFLSCTSISRKGDGRDELFTRGNGNFFSANSDERWKNNHAVLKNVRVFSPITIHQTQLSFSQSPSRLIWINDDVY